ncbi:hydroxyacid dehydrogenase [Arthrobacter agilis]|uniref:2-hydroxyacid dehydrogenase n=1 Tax=Arthrobacter agilis TaxID=37921 RepID=UPI000B361196|nr:2-hydroxyacid dehydrogenase [Arthrobacter agilis]OUM44211.1 hydroxyacid dehydrogenase [Arthrobacter agilis]PPB46586.1 hydroxyacid dehydrogenase [Arthrobacter agilis]TPV23756.1 hydroxyacid dehydrogenase [Arthrobacter agilis]VDR32485.1 Glyoxylate/hydroxypyruvate reductase A [Arthrobacter agilis]
MTTPAGTSATPTIRTVSVPTADLREALADASPDVDVVLWDFRSPPEGCDPGRLDAAVLPYTGRAHLDGALDAATNLRLVHTQSTGFDGIADLVGPDVAIATASGVHAAATAELAVGLALASLRGIDDAVRQQAEGVWRSERYPGLADRRVLLVGVGGIGEEIRRRLVTFEAEVTRVGSAAREDDLGQVHGSDELVRLAPDHDVVIVITPLTDATRGLIGSEVLAALPDGALVVNVARGVVVDTEALTAEVLSGRLKAALDVVDPEPLPEGHPLWSAPGAIITPHVGGNTGAFPPRILALLRKQIALLGKGEKPLNLVRTGSWTG